MPRIPRACVLGPAPLEPDRLGTPSYSTYDRMNRSALKSETSDPCPIPGAPTPHPDLTTRGFEPPILALQPEPRIPAPHPDPNNAPQYHDFGPTPLTLGLGSASRSPTPSPALQVPTPDPGSAPQVTITAPHREQRVLAWNPDYRAPALHPEAPIHGSWPCTPGPRSPSRTRSLGSRSRPCIPTSCPGPAA